MSVIPSLKKKLKSIRATEKISKAMKTVSSVKFSKLSTLYKTYSEYAREFSFLYENEGKAENENPDCVIIMGSNKGFCGSFNSETVAFASKSINHGQKNIFIVGEKLRSIFTENKISFDGCFVFGDIPTYEECEPLFDKIFNLAENKDFCLKIIYPKYKNTMTQIPCENVFTLHHNISDVKDDILFVPDRETVLKDLYRDGFCSILYGAVLETALGAQAATLMTMRSAYDTAFAYCESIEGEIHRTRQSEVTADVIETSSTR